MDELPEFRTFKVRVYLIPAMDYPCGFKLKALAPEYHYDAFTDMAKAILLGEVAMQKPSKESIDASVEYQLEKVEEDYSQALSDTAKQFKVASARVKRAADRCGTVFDPGPEGYEERILE